MPDKTVDACCLINVYASGSAIDIMQALGKEIFIPDLVKRESLFIRKEDDQGEGILVPETIDLSSALASGVLRECALENDHEFDEFVRLASMLDDGEALCIALAKCRAWIVATDDRKALKIAQSEGVQTITTPEIIKNWADSCSISAASLCNAVRSIERYARFTPRRNAVLYQWWDQLG